MRRVFGALLVLAFPVVAAAADLDVLRGAFPVGPATFANWSGFYAGGQFGLSDGTGDFRHATQPLIAFNLRQTTLEDVIAPSQWQVLNKETSRAESFGGFVGYNTQWQNLILGVEANYSHSPMTITASETPISRIVVAGSNTYLVNLQGSGSISITDYGSLRARFGWIYNNFLPYGFAGLALGHGTYTVTASDFGEYNLSTATAPVVPCTNPPTATCVPFSDTSSTGKASTFLYGFTVGGGVDIALARNFFLRGELEYIQFAEVSGIVASIATARVGAGVRF
jgi:outer membrane immunogenic protein